MHINEYVSRIFLTRRLSAVGLRHIVTERFNQLNIIVTNDCILIKKRKGEEVIIALLEQTLSSAAVSTSAMR
jgi:hypothetical protein